MQRLKLLVTYVKFEQHTTRSQEEREREEGRDRERARGRGGGGGISHLRQLIFLQKRTSSRVVLRCLK